MKLKTTIYALFVVCLFFVHGNTSFAQVGVNTTSPSPSAALEISSDNKGILIPRVSLTGSDDTTTITPSATTGLLVYQTVNAGSGNTRVTPGFCYWSGSRWRRLKNRGYSLELEQTASVTAVNFYDPFVAYDLPGLDTGTFTPSFTGVYQIMVTAYYSAANKTGSTDGASQGSIRIVMETAGSGSFSTLRQQYVTSSSKETGSTDLENLPQSVFLVYNVDLTAGTTYRIKVQGREWRTSGADYGAVFGRDSSTYAGAGGDTDAQLGKMTISLVSQR